MRFSFPSFACEIEKQDLNLPPKVPPPPQLSPGPIIKHAANYQPIKSETNQNSYSARNGVSVPKPPLRLSQPNLGPSSKGRSRRSLSAVEQLGLKHPPPNNFSNGGTK